MIKKGINYKLNDYIKYLNTNDIQRKIIGYSLEYQIALHHI